MAGYNGYGGRYYADARWRVRTWLDWGLLWAVLSQWTVQGGPGFPHRTSSQRPVKASAGIPLPSDGSFEDFLLVGYPYSISGSLPKCCMAWLGQGGTHQDLTTAFCPQTGPARALHCRHQSIHLWDANRTGQTLCRKSLIPSKASTTCCWSPSAKAGVIPRS